MNGNYYNTRSSSVHNRGYTDQYSNNSSSNYYQQYQNQKMMSKNNQKIIQDQNYSNETFFMMISTLESLVDFFTNKTKDFSNKMFKNYDRVNYSSKNLQELKSQLNIHIFLLQASKKIWMMENPRVEWQLPQNFSKDKAFSFVQNSLRIFESNAEKDCIKMCYDIKDLLNNKLHGLNIDKMNFNPEYSQKERQNFNKNLIGHGLQANESMRGIEEQSRNYKEVSDLKARLNPHSSKFTQFQEKNNYDQALYNKFPKHSFLIFKETRLYQNQNLSNSIKYKHISQITQNYGCQIIKSIDQLYSKKSQLINRKSKIVPIKLSCNQIIEVQNAFSFKL